MRDSAVHCPIYNKHAYAINTFQGLPLNIPEDTKQEVTKAVKVDITKNRQFYCPIKVDNYITDIVSDTTFGQGFVVLSRYYSGKMTLITRSGYFLHKVNPASLYFYGREFYYSHRAYHHVYCSICQTLDFHDTVFRPKSR